MLDALRDMAKNSEIFLRHKNERVATVSLFRSVSEEKITGRFRRLAEGNADLTAFAFNYEIPAEPDGTSATLEVSVVPDSHPPTNVHVIIGRNGVGKTRAITSLAKEITTRNEFEIASENDSGLSSFASLVYVSFSAFDEFTPRPSSEIKIKFGYVGLNRIEDGDPETDGGASGSSMASSTAAMLRADFKKSAAKCLKGIRRKRWIQMLRLLETDPIFEETNIAGLIERLASPSILAEAFESLSSGHKVVLLTITRLVELVEERSLVIMDEPEVHLHPPLLSAFIRALSTLLGQRNGVALVATHSPVILQEVPRSCVTVLNRFGLQASASRPDSETFGENVGTLTREIFGLEVLHSGFNQLLKTAAVASGSYSDALQSLGGQVGAEGKALLRIHCDQEWLPE